MTEAQTQAFVAALDKVDMALFAIRMEFEELAQESAARLAAIKAKEQQHRERQPA